MTIAGIRRGRVGRSAAVLVAAGLTAGLASCGEVVTGSATWPGARLEKVLLTEADFPPGVQYDPIIDKTGLPDGAGGPPAMLSDPSGCSDGLTRVIAASAERGPGSAAKYRVSYDGARIVMTVLSWPLDLAKLAETAQRCAQFRAFFDTTSDGIPITTTRLPDPRTGALAYEQTMRLGQTEHSVYFSFANVDTMAVFGIAFPTPDPTVGVKATLPQTFLDVAGKQAERMAAR